MDVIEQILLKSSYPVIGDLNLRTIVRSSPTYDDLYQVGRVVCARAIGMTLLCHKLFAVSLS